MHRFFFKLFLFLLPLFILLVFPLLILLRAGELTLPNKIISLAVNDKKHVLYGPAYGGYLKSLKVASTNYYKPEILALGDSRVLQIRSEFFNPQVKFYNAGLAVSSLPDFRTFLDFIPNENQPKILIVDINQQFFNAATYVNKDQGGKKLMSPMGFSNQVSSFVSSWGHVYRHYFIKHKFSLQQVFKKQDESEKLLGMEAIVQLKGFRNDGSYYDGQYVLGRAPMPSGFDFAAARRWIETGDENLPYGQEVSEAALNELKLFLDECKKRKIQVIGFVAPFPHQVYQQLNDSGKYNYFLDAPGKIKPLFDEHDFEFYDYADLKSLGASDDEATDAAHASEKAYLRLFVDMLSRGSKLNAYSNRDFLTKILHSATSPLNVFPDNFSN